MTYIVPNAVSMRNQENDYDCWYASIRMMLEYHNRQPPSESEFEARLMIGKLTESFSGHFQHEETLLPPTDTQQFPVATLPSPVPLTMTPPRFDENDAIAISAELGLVVIMPHDGVPLSAYKIADLERLLKMCGPLVCGLAKSDGNGHMVVIKGVYDNGTVICNDPDPSGLFSNIMVPIRKGTNGEDAAISFRDMVKSLSYFMAVVDTESKWVGKLGRWACEANTTGW
jgi:hypothetical protein